ncbi:hypothetical protein Tco_1129968 [Tanacetum coccineum]
MRFTSSDFTAPLLTYHPLTHATPVLVPSICKTARMAVRVQPAMLPGCSACIAEVETMEDADEERGYESLDEYDEGHDLDVVGHELEDESHGLDDEGRRVESDRLGLEEEAAHEGQQWATSVVETLASEPLGLGYGALRRRGLAAEEDQIHNPQDGRSYIDIPTYPPPTLHAQTPPSSEWSSGSLPIFPAPSVVPSPILSSMISLTVPSPIASPVATPTTIILVDEDQFIEINRDVRELYTRSEAVRNEIFSYRYQLRSLEHEQERIVVTFRALWRPVLALEACAGHVDTQMADMSRTGDDNHRLVNDLLVQQAALQREL